LPCALCEFIHVSLYLHSDHGNGVLYQNV